MKLAVVHHSVSSNSYSQAQVPSVIRGIQAYHMDGRGWDDIGYNFVVDRYGGIWEGRGGGATEPVVGAHASGFNTGTVGVMLLGDFSSAQPTSASVQSAGRVIGWKLPSMTRSPRAASRSSRVAGLGTRPARPSTCPVWWATSRSDPPPVRAT
ncbi:MAG: N-acetylmuramoyl-L-alanine amidase [Microthrixaceae bacterium]